MTNKTLTPRQRMINMMYLVLIALLALNVSREILKSFHLFELSFISANKNADFRNTKTIENFRMKMENPKTKARTEKWYELAKQASAISREFYKNVERMKTDITVNGGGRETPNKGSLELPELKRPDDMDVHVYYFAYEGLDNGRKLQQMINETRERLLSLVLPARKGELIKSSLIKSTQLKAFDPEKGSAKFSTWVSMNLENAPLAGVVTLLTKTQNDCKALEADVLAVLNENINIESISNNAQFAMIIPENKAVMSGESFKASIALVTYDTRTASQMLVNGKPIIVTNGIGNLTIPASGTGSHRIEASIESIDPKTGEPTIVRSEPLTWNSYQASASISADNMNVLFIGLENPMSISIPGITPENTFVNSNNGITLKNLGSGKYLASVKSGMNNGKIFVNARMQDGSIKSMGEMDYKIRRVPTPKFRVGNLSSGTFEKSTIMSQTYLYAYLEDFYFKGLQFKVTKCHLTLLKKGSMNSPDITVNGGTTEPARSLISSARSGDILYFDEIFATGPVGSIRLESMSLKVK